jgi:hypothetical protein
MKKLAFILVMIGASVILLMAQDFKKTTAVKEHEVPVAVRVSFENEFGKLPTEGNWTVTFSLLHEGSKTVAKPLWYTFSRKDKINKIEVRYSPDGKLESFKGIDKVDRNAGSASSSKIDS